VSMVLLLFSLVLYLGGGELTKVVGVPILFLVFAMPVSTFYYARAAEPLQELAAYSSAFILQLFGVDIHATHSSLALFSLSGVLRPLTVEEACSGMRLLMAFLALGVAIAYLEDRPLWQRIVLVVMGVPVAIACNVLRVTITCVMYVMDKPEMGSNFMHEFTGILMLIPAFLMLWFIGWLMQSLIVEVDEDEPQQAAGGEAK
jgi:exosortase